MGYGLCIRTYDQALIKKVEEENINFTFQGDKKFNFYKDIFKEDTDENSDTCGERIEGKTIWEESAYYSVFIEITTALLTCIAKELPNFKLTGSGRDLTWKLEDPESMTKEQDDFFYGIVPLINYVGDSSGWTWTWHELQNGKNLLIKHNLWDKVAAKVNRKGWEDTNIGDIYNKVIENQAVLELW